MEMERQTETFTNSGKKLIFYMFRAIDICKQVYHQQTAPIPEHESTPTCFGYYIEPSSGKINT
jgi:hypothetical protein